MSILGPNPDDSSQNHESAIESALDFDPDSQFYEE